MGRLIMTTHAKKRWGQRFSNLSAEYEYKRSKKPKKVALSNIKKQCPEHVSIMKRKEIYGLSYRLSPNGVVFVCNEEDVIVTVFPYKAQVDKNIEKTGRVYKQGKFVNRNSYKNWW